MEVIKKSNKYHILYLDDEIGNLKTFQMAFRREYFIYITEFPETALDYIEKNDVDLVITDQRMPIMTGVEFLKKLKKIKPFKPPSRMILSGYSRSSDIEKAIERYELSMFISKPWKPKDLKLKINKVIENCNPI